MPLPADPMKTPTHLLNLLGAPTPIPLDAGGGVKASVTLDLPPGLYRVGAEVDGSRFEVRVPAGAMDGWEMYRPESGKGWITELT